MQRSNRRATPTLIRLDRVFINHAWNDRFPSSSLSSLTRDTSDHVPLIATISTSIPKRGFFRYDAAWGLHASFRSTIASHWRGTSRSDPTSQLVARLRQCRFRCKAWAKRRSSSLLREQDCRLLINLLDILEESRPLSLLENRLRSLTMDSLHLAIKERSLYWRTRAKVRYALEGDENTRFFHTSATCRLRRNSITSLEMDGVTTTSHPGKALILKAYYSELLGAVSPTSWRFDLRSLYPAGPSLPMSLSAPFTRDEIKLAFLSMNRLSSPGPDGFGPAFFSSFWDTVAPDVFAVFDSFYKGNIDLTRINRAFLVLLPKTDGANNPSLFRPISLQNCIMKAITKVLTTRLQAAIHSLVDAD